MTQIGITNFPEDRLADHQSRGWVVVEVRGPDNGDHVRALEVAALKALKKRGAIIGGRKTEFKFDGFTESWPSSSIQELLGWIRSDESET